MRLGCNPDAITSGLSANAGHSAYGHIRIATLTDQEKQRARKKSKKPGAKAISTEMLSRRLHARAPRGIWASTGGFIPRRPSSAIFAKIISSDAAGMLARSDAQSCAMAPSLWRGASSGAGDLGGHSAGRVKVDLDSSIATVTLQVKITLQ